jgi:D-sedoheptulose 7-phosphate isomerase
MAEGSALVEVALRESLHVKTRLVKEQLGNLLGIARVLTEVLCNHGTIYLCGNGGSAADAQHVAAEFVGRFLRERRPLPAVALTTNSSILTAIGNDYAFDQIFARQVRAQVTSRDVVVGISTSGKSANVLNALAAARDGGAKTVGFTGEPGEPLGAASDLCLKAPSANTPRIQEAHLLAWHVICDLAERNFADGQ